MREKSSNFIGGQEDKGKPGPASGPRFWPANRLSLGCSPVDDVLERRQPPAAGGLGLAEYLDLPVSTRAVGNNAMQVPDFAGAVECLDIFGDKVDDLIEPLRECER